MKCSNRSQTLMIMAAWLCILGSIAYWFEMDTRREEKQRALTTANAFFQQVLVSRLWNASHGGVYVPITTTTQPNPYLPVQDRDLTADNGLRLTKINPSYMTRQTAELAEKNASGIQFHITSLKPIRPENKAMEWEERWLKSFEQGVKEQGEFVEDGNIAWFRYMAPLVTGPECLKCHAQQGYKEGDIRGASASPCPITFTTTSSSSSAMAQWRALASSSSSSAPPSISGSSVCLTPPSIARSRSALPIKIIQF